jgi:hypothetical protein
VIYSPPEGEAVIRDKLADLDRFINDAFFDALGWMAEVLTVVFHIKDCFNMA